MPYRVHQELGPLGRAREPLQSSTDDAGHLIVDRRVVLQKHQDSIVAGGTRIWRVVEHWEFGHVQDWLIQKTTQHKLFCLNLW